jgi:hypothetical protein
MLLRACVEKRTGRKPDSFQALAIGAVLCKPQATEIPRRVNSTGKPVRSRLANSEVHTLRYVKTHVMLILTLHLLHCVGV